MLLAPKQDRTSPTRSQPADLPSKEAAAEIQAYIAIRDGLMEDAEKFTTVDKLNAASVANDCVIAALRPARAPYGAQCLPEPEAVGERRKCEGVRRRIAERRSMLTLPAARRAA